MYSRVAAIVGLAIALSPLVASWSSPYIQFDQRLIPELPGPLPILTLGPHASIPQNLLQQLVRSTDPNATLTTDSTTGDQFAYHGDNLIAFVNASSGETRVFPNLGVLEPRIQPINANLTFQYISNTNMFPVDHTNISLAKGADLAGSIAISGHDPTPPQVFLSHFVVQRNITVDDISYPVCGPGSKASFGFGADQNLHSLSYLWQPATFSGRSARPDSTYAIFDSIIQQLIPVSSSTNILRVDGVDICFYDSASRHIQPVYRFSATLHADTVDNVASAPIRILGYLPIGRDSPEPVPCISKPSDVSTQPTFPNSTISSRTEKRQARPTVTVGRYVVRNDTYQWVINANNFLNNLQHPSSGTPVANFVDNQYYWAYPFEFTSQKNTYINSVQIAEIEVHGNWHVFSTYSNCCDLVHLADIPPDGYGGGANGSLAYWIIHSCEVIPTPTDYAAADFHLAFDVWFSIFNGLHAVVGYRTEMWIADSVMPTFGSLISIGAPFVPAWLQTVHDDIADYGARLGNFYLDGNRHIIEPMGRASAVVVCGHEQDNVLRTENLGRPVCLREFWYEN